MSWWRQWFDTSPTSCCYLIYRRQGPSAILASTDVSASTVCAEFIWVAFCIISQHSTDAGSWKPSSWRLEPVCLSITVNDMAVVGLATQEDRASTASILTWFSWNIWASAPEGSMLNHVVVVCRLFRKEAYLLPYMLLLIIRLIYCTTE